MRAAGLLAALMLMASGHDVIAAASDVKINLVESGFIDRARLVVHALLGDKIIFLPLGSFGFAALAGIGGGLILDYVDPKRSRKLLGWTLLCGGIPLGALCLLLGLS